MFFCCYIKEFNRESGLWVDFSSVTTLAVFATHLFCFTKEVDAALGNGGLARLSACQMDSLATLDYPAWGYMVMHEFNVFQVF